MTERPLVDSGLGTLPIVVLGPGGGAATTVDAEPEAALVGTADGKSGLLEVERAGAGGFAAIIRAEGIGFTAEEVEAPEV